MRLFHSTAAAIPLCLVATSAAFAATDPVYKAMRDAAIADTVFVENIELHRDAGVLTLKSGTIGFTAPAMGRDTVAVFVGEGEFKFTPGPSVEKAYLKSLTNQDTVVESFDHALFCFSDDTGKEIRGQAKTHAADPKAADILRDYRKRLRNRSEMPRSFVEAMLMSDSMDNVEADLLADLYNAHQAGFFSAYLHGRKHSDLRFHVRPRGAFPELGTPEEVALINLDPEAPQEGIWYLSHLATEFQKHTASSDENNRIVEAESYKIETTIGKNDHLAATAALKFHAVTDGDRVIKFALLPNLRVTRASAGGQEIPFIQEDRKEDGSLYVVMPAPMAKGSVHEIALEYGGDKVIQKAGAGNYSVAEREDWYPNVNAFRDHARYDLTFRVPKADTLVAVGKLAKSWTDKDEACTQWISETPIAVAGFNYGQFKSKKTTDPQSGFGIEGYANPELPDSLRAAEMNGINGINTTGLMDKGMIDAQNASRIFSAWFGKSEFDRIAVTQSPQFGMGQSWPTLVYLPLSSFLDSTIRWQLMGHISSGLNDFVDEVTEHEVSHQWWGHMVGWSTYHDQWLSEGFATFSAGLFLQLTEKTPDKYLKYWESARKRILDKNEFGRRANDAGPVWLGLRLSSAKNDLAYQDVVYRKGAYVLHMLRMVMFDPKEGDKAFKEMMQDYVRQNMNRNASTETFQHVVEQHMTPAMNAGGNGKMDWFFNQWVYGTTIPRYKFDYTVTPADGGKFLLEGSVTQSEVTPDFMMPVPIYVDFDGQIVRLGTAFLKGNTTTGGLHVLLPKKPKRVMINYWHDILEAQ
jgi:hypothetical protein